MNKILVLEGNPALQKTLVFKDFRPGLVNRASALRIYTGGKGTNFCRAGNIFHKADYELLHFTGGENGRKADELLAKEGIKTFSVKIQAETRCCVTCLNESDGSMTELIEPSSPLTEKDQKEFLSLLQERLPECSAAAISGSLPDGTESIFYTQWAEKITFSNTSSETPCRKAGGFLSCSPRYPTWVITLLPLEPGEARVLHRDKNFYFIILPSNPFIKKLRKCFTF